MLPGDKLQSNLEETTCSYCLKLAEEGRPKDVQSKQVGGSHYVEQDIQPWDVMKSMADQFSDDMFTPFQWHMLFCALKYAMRCGRKGPAEEDIDKAIHYLERLKEDLL
jgi:hypothetical protein